MFAVDVERGKAARSESSKDEETKWEGRSDRDRNVSSERSGRIFPVVETVAELRFDQRSDCMRENSTLRK